MIESIKIDLLNRQQAWAAIKSQLFPFLAEALQGQSVFILEVRKKKRSDAQNRRYWGRGVLAQISEQAKIGGRRYSPESWHEQFKRQFIGVIELPNGQVQGKSSTDLTTSEFSDFCAQVEAFAASELGVVFYDLE